MRDIKWFLPYLSKNIPKSPPISNDLISTIKANRCVTNGNLLVKYYTNAFTQLVRILYWYYIYYISKANKFKRNKNCTSSKLWNLKCYLTLEINFMNPVVKQYIFLWNRQKSTVRKSLVKPGILRIMSVLERRSHSHTSHIGYL